MEPTLEQKRQVILANCGGLEAATDAQILTIWSQLSPEAKESYQAKTKPAKPKATKGAPTNANGT